MEACEVLDHSCGSALKYGRLCLQISIWCGEGCYQFRSLVVIMSTGEDGVPLILRVFLDRTCDGNGVDVLHERVR
jgi:hypothetical protein